MADKVNPRPLSPHLQTYRPQLTSVMSILHRMAGGALAVGTLAVVLALLAAATGTEAWESYHRFFQTVLGRILLSGWAAAFFYHMCNGVRHLTWDTVHALEIRSAYAFGYAVLLVAGLLTLATWWRIWW